MTNRFQVIRTHISPYQRKEFLEEEKKLVARFPNLTYSAPETPNGEDVILITNTHTQLRELPTSLLAKTRLIVHPNSGYDHFATEQDLWKNIPMVIGHDIRAQAVAEYSLRALFEGLVELPQHVTWLKDRTWNRTLLSESSVWVFGYGHIGKIVADTLASLGMNVTVVDPFVEHCRHKLLRDWKNGNLNEARAVVAAMSLNPTSQHLFNEDFFAAASGRLLFINGARGKLVDEKALREFLLSHPEAFAFLDVFDKEPFGDEWHGFPQVWKTSHIAGVEKALDQKILAFEERVLSDYSFLDRTDFFKKYKNEIIQNKWIKGVLV